MIDRLEELKTLIESSLPYQPPSILPGSTKDYFQKVENANRSLKKVKKISDQIKTLKKTFSVSASPEEETQIRLKLKELIDCSNNELNKIRKISESLSDELKVSQDLENFDKRLKTTVYATLMKQFQDMIAESQSSQNEFDKYARTKVSAQLRMIEENLDDETVSECIDNPKLATQLIEKQMIGGHTDLIVIVNKIEDRLQDIKMLEENIKIMHKMFLDLAVLVESQGELLNSIEAHIDTASEYIAHGIKAVEDAGEQLKSARSKKCCVLVIILIIGAIITLPIVGVKYF
jgi:t-SNARE complex subunit (syntaxin)